MCTRSPNSRRTMGKRSRADSVGGPASRPPTTARRPPAHPDDPSRRPCVLEVLDAAAVRRWCSAGRRDLAAARDEIDDLNVYPVPDGDTGTNLLLTMEAVERRRPRRPRATSPRRCRRWRTARSWAPVATPGVILSQLLRGLRRGAGGRRVAGRRPARARARRRAGVRRGRPAGRGHRCSPSPASAPRRSRVSTATSPRSCARPGRRPPSRCAAPPTCCRRCRPPGSSTPAVAGSACCSRRSRRW